MNTRTLRNFWINLALYLMLAFDIMVIKIARPEAIGSHLGLHIHTILSILLTLGCMVHIALHWQWYRAVLIGKAKGKIKLFMTSMVTIMMMLAGISGHAALTSASASGFHSFTGSMALIGLFIHGVKHVRWMVLTAKKLVGHERHHPQLYSSERG